MNISPMGLCIIFSALAALSLTWWKLRGRRHLGPLGPAAFFTFLAVSGALFGGFDSTETLAALLVAALFGGFGLWAHMRNRSVDGRGAAKPQG